MADIFEGLTASKGQPGKGAVREGITFATVTDIKDPKNLGRVKCKYVSANEDAGETGWIYCMTMYGGSEMGAFFHPNVNDLVVIAFEDGDPHRPFVIGSTWFDKVKPPVPITGGKNEECKLITPGENVVDIIDTKGKQAIEVSTPKNRKIRIDDEKKTITVTDGKNSLTMNEESGQIEIKADKKMVIQVGNGVTVTIDGGGKISIDSKQKVEISTSQFAVQAKGTAEVKSNSSITVQSTGLLTLKGSATKIN